MSCEQCTQGYVLPGEPAGSIVDGAYFHPAPEGSPKSSAIVLLTDIFGLPLKNSKLIADELSKGVGCDVWVPDLFAGNPPFKVEELEPLMPQRPSESITFVNTLRMIVLALSRAFRLYGVRGSVVDSRINSFIQKVKEEKTYENIGAVGYCFGGSVGIRLGQTDLVNSLVICHPGGCTVAQIKAIKVPTSWVCAESDMTFKPPLRNQAEAVFAARKEKEDYVDYEFKDYRGTVHGFAARPNLGIPEVYDAYKAALDQTVAWFQKTL
ncbi:hypothetical protein EW026_g6571 [Hermanssonia centrifuga]|uniref:Dienelactone hydrolase domain-containing protein n=1 Tax=Hermanssonia centrifuga TaxID=98765 RepID=A0A4S4KEY0_9APHY|nr:hypothetical protein EW026_g6571 [Hermanssonia centrifuga]